MLRSKAAERRPLLARGAAHRSVSEGAQTPGKRPRGLLSPVRTMEFTYPNCILTIFLIS
jgi:hypothetical protein